MEPSFLSFLPGEVVAYSLIIIYLVAYLTQLSVAYMYGIAGLRSVLSKSVQIKKTHTHYHNWHY